MSNLFQLVEPWLMEDDDDNLISLRDQLVWLQKELFDQYEPNRYESFDDCLATWLQNIDNDESRKAMFKLIEHLFFIGKQQIDSLSRSAFSDQTIRWLVDILNLDIADPKLSECISTAVAQTWFCPITDSMRINGFLKVNGLKGHGYRPDWRSLKQFGDPSRVKNYVTGENIKRLVLVEDFVGTGVQIDSTVRWAAQTLSNTPILVAPLVCCPKGIESGNKLASQLANVSFSPCLSLRKEFFLDPTPQPNEPSVFNEIRGIIKNIKFRLGDWEVQPYGFCNTGAIIVLYSNCPDNTLPIIHHSSDQWKPLFSRVRRD